MKNCLLEETDKVTHQTTKITCTHIPNCNLSGKERSILFSMFYTACAKIHNHNNIEINHSSLSNR